MINKKNYSQIFIANSSILFVLLPLIGISILHAAVNIDEISNILVYASDWRTLLLRTFPNNHLISTIIGYLASGSFGYNIVAFRLVSLISSIAIFFVIFISMKRAGCYFGILVSLTPLFGVELYFLYSSLYRGYVLQALFILIAALLAYRFVAHEKKKDLIISNILFSLAFLHIPTTIYIWIPAMLTIISVRHTRKDIKALLQSFILPAVIVFFVHLVSIALTGYAMTKPSTLNMANFIKTMSAQPLNVLWLGVKAIFLIGSFDLSRSYILYFKAMINNITYMSVIFFIFLCLIAVYLARVKCIKRIDRNIILLFFLYGFLFHVILHQTPPIRVYIMYLPILAFIFGYLVDRLAFYLKEKYRFSMIKVYLTFFITCSIIVTIKAFSHTSADYSGYDLFCPTADRAIKQIVAKHDCNGTNNIDGDFRQRIAFFTQQECSQKWPLSRIRALIKNRPVEKNKMYYAFYKGGLKESKLRNEMHYDLVPIIEDDEVVVYENLSFQKVVEGTKN